MTALLNEIDLTAGSSNGDSLTEETMDTIFFGGGTPSTLSPEEIHAILEKLREHFVVRQGCRNYNGVQSWCS